MPLTVGPTTFKLVGRQPVVPSGKLSADVSGKVVAQILPVDVGASGGKVRAVLAHERGSGISLELASREFPFTYDMIGVPGDQYLHEGSLFAGVRNSLVQASIDGGVPASVRRLVTVDTMGAGAKVMDGLSVLEPPFFYMHQQRTRGHNIAVERLGVAGENEALKIIQLATGGQATCPVYNIFHLLSIFEKYGIAANNSRVIDLPGIIYQYLTQLADVPIESSFLRVTLGGNTAATDWNYELLQKLGLPTEVFKKTRVVPSGTTLATFLRPENNWLGGLNGSTIDVIAGATHDSAGAIFALALNGSLNDIYLTSGSWNIMGMPVSLEDMTPDFLEALFNRNLGVEGATGALFAAGNVQGGRMFDALMPTLGLQVGDYRGFYKIFQEHDDVIPGLVDNMSPRLRIEHLGADLSLYCKNSGQSEITRPDRDEGERRSFLAKTLVLSEILGMMERIAGYSDLMRLKGRTPERILVGGGLAMGDNLMMAALADATGLKVVRTVRGLAGFGNAILALGAAGLAKPDQLKLALAAASTGETFEPDAYEKSKWDEIYRDYLRAKAQLQ